MILKLLNVFKNEINPSWSSPRTSSMDKFDEVDMQWLRVPLRQTANISHQYNGWGIPSMRRQAACAASVWLDARACLYWRGWGGLPLTRSSPTHWTFSANMIISTRRPKAPTHHSQHSILPSWRTPYARPTWTLWLRRTLERITAGILWNHAELTMSTSTRRSRGGDLFLTRRPRSSPGRCRRTCSSSPARRFTRRFLM